MIRHYHKNIPAGLTTRTELKKALGMSGTKFYKLMRLNLIPDGDINYGPKMKGYSVQIVKSIKNNLHDLGWIK